MILHLLLDNTYMYIDTSSILDTLLEPGIGTYYASTRIQPFSFTVAPNPKLSLDL